MPSRGLTGSELSNSRSLWIGPEFLSKPETEWPTTADVDNVEDANLELIKDVPIVSHSFAVLNTQFRLQEVIDLKRSSNLRKLLNTTAYVFRFIKALQTQSNGNGSSMSSRASSFSLPTGEEIKQSELNWIKSVQGDSF